MISKSIGLLVIEDNIGDARIIEEYLKNIKNFVFNLKFSVRLTEAINLLERTPFDLILLDLSLPDSKKTESLSTLLDKNLNIPIIILTGLDDEEHGIASVKKGAQDYLVKGELDKVVLSRSILYAIERFKIEKKLKKSEEKYKNERDNLMNILESLQDGVLIINGHYDIEYVNPAFIKEFGSYEGKKCFQYLFDRSSYCPNCKKNNILSGNIVREEFNLKNIQKTFDFVGTSLNNPDGGKSILVILHDITRLKQVEQKLREISSLKTEFLNRVSHELKTPLVVMKGYLDLMLNQKRQELNSDTIVWLEEMERGYERLQDKIEKLLITSHLDSPSYTLNPKTENLSFLINKCIRDLSSLLQLRNHSLKLDIDEDLYGEFVKEEIYEVISNLLSNAINNTPKGGKIKIKSEIKDSTIIVSIQDNGVGITVDEKDRLFKKFGKIERYGKKLDVLIDGTGLGLYVSKKILKLHGGNIWVESEGRDKGSTFYFSLPYKSIEKQQNLLIS